MSGELTNTTKGKGAAKRSTTNKNPSISGVVKAKGLAKQFTTRMRDKKENPIQSSKTNIA